MSNSSSEEEEEYETFKPGNSRSRSIKSDEEDDTYEDESESSGTSSDTESESDEIYGASSSKNKKSKKQKSIDSDTSDSDEDWGSKKKQKRNKKEVIKKSLMKTPKKVTSGIVSDEDEESDFEDEEFGSISRRKVVPTGEIEFRQDWSDPKLRIVEQVGDWNEEKDEFLIKWKGRSWNCATWLPSSAPELQVARRKVDNFVKKVGEERSEGIYENGGESFNEEGTSVTLETLRYNLLENWRVVERVIALRETSGQGTFYLCKWRALGYSECTWEWEGDIRGLPSDSWKKVDEFLARQYGKNRTNSTGSRSFQRYKAQPEIFSKELTLRDYQLDGLNWLLYSWCRRVNVILADEMGLGKTIQSVCFLTALKAHYGTSGPTLLVVPLSTIDAWQREFGLWAGDLLNVIVYTGDGESRATARKYEFPGGFDVLLTTYELVLKDQAILSSVKWRLLLVDEGHRLKNASSQLYDALFTLVPTSGRVLITGTPLQNSLGELWCLLRFLMPEKFSDYDDFLQRYSVDLGREGEDESNSRLEELHALIKPHILRRLKRDVEHTLPGKTEKIIRVDLTPLQKQLYRYILTRNYRDLKRTQEAAGNRAVGGLLNILGELKKVCNHPLLLGTGSPALKELNAAVDTIKPDESGKLLLLQRLLRRLKDEGHRVLIFSQSVRMLDILQNFVKSEGYVWQRLDGSTTSVARHLAITTFNSPESKDFVFLLSTRAGGLGINLATADTVIIYDSDWNPQNDLQAMARAHRIGQKKTVRIFRLVSAGTVEEEILERAKRKMVLDHLVIQQLKKGNGTTSDLQAILKFGAKSLFESDKPGIPASAVDLDAIFSEAESSNTSADSSTPAENEEFLGQFRIADLGTWDEIIPADERIKIEEEQRKAEELSKEVELQEALLTAATGRRGRTTVPVNETKKESTPVKQTRDKAQVIKPESDDLVLFPTGGDVALKAYDSLSRFGLCDDEGWGVKIMNRLEEITGAVDDPSRLPCHFRVIEGSPLQKAALPGLLDRIKGLKALQGCLNAYKSRAKEDDIDLMSGFRLSVLGIKAPLNWPIASYSVPQDSTLLVAVGRFGYGNWQGIRQELSEHNSPGWSKLQGPQITRRVDYLLKELVGSSKSKSTKTASNSTALDETRVIEKFRRPFKPLRTSLLALESLKNSTESSDSTTASLLTDHLKKLGDFIESDSSLRSDRESWDFIGCFWPYQKGSTGKELRSLYESLKK